MKKQTVKIVLLFALSTLATVAASANIIGADKIICINSEEKISSKELAQVQNFVVLPEQNIIIFNDPEEGQFDYEISRINSRGKFIEIQFRSSVTETVRINLETQSASRTEDFASFSNSKVTYSKCAFMQNQQRAALAAPGSAPEQLESQQ